MIIIIVLRFEINFRTDMRYLGSTALDTLSTFTTKGIRHEIPVKRSIVFSVVYIKVCSYRVLESPILMLAFGDIS